MGLPPPPYRKQRKISGFFSNPVASRAKDIIEILKPLLEQDYMKY